MEDELAALQDHVETLAEEVAGLRASVDALTQVIDRAVRVAVATGGLQLRTRG